MDAISEKRVVFISAETFKGQHGNASCRRSAGKLAFANQCAHYGCERHRQRGHRRSHPITL